LNDDDSDGICGNDDTCPDDSLNDEDSDNVCSSVDSCPLDPFDNCGPTTTTPTTTTSTTTTTTTDIWNRYVKWDEVPLDTWIIVGGAGGGILLLIIIIAVVVCCCKKKEAEKRRTGYRVAEEDYQGIEINSPTKTDPGTSDFGDDASQAPEAPPRRKKGKGKKKGSKTEPEDGKARSSRHSVKSKRSSKSKKKGKDKKAKKTKANDSGWSPNPQDMKSSAFEASLKEFFEKFNPAKVSDVPKMAKIYNKKRGKLFDKLNSAYHVVPRFHSSGGKSEETIKSSGPLAF